MLDSERRFPAQLGFLSRSVPSPSGKAEACKASILGSNPSGTSNIETSRPLAAPARAVPAGAPSPAPLCSLAVTSRPSAVRLAPFRWRYVASSFEPLRCDPRAPFTALKRVSPRRNNNRLWSEFIGLYGFLGHFSRIAWLDLCRTPSIPLDQSEEDE